jgi:hypothetical protein
VQYSRDKGGAESSAEDGRGAPGDGERGYRAGNGAPEDKGKGEQDSKGASATIHAWVYCTAYAKLGQRSHRGLGVPGG